MASQAGTSFDCVDGGRPAGSRWHIDGNGTGGEPPLANLEQPRGLVTLDGKIYFVDATYVRVFDPEENTVATVTGKGSAVYQDGTIS